MTLGDLLSQMGIGPKHLSERLSHGDYGGGHDSHVIYAYEPTHASHGHVASSKHHHGGGGHKSNAAMSALTLLAFLFFLHILQQCLKDHMAAMSTAPVVIVSGREGEDAISKSAAKLDKSGKNKPTDVVDAKNDNDNLDSKYEKNILTKINTAEHTPNIDGTRYRLYQNYGNRSLSYKGFVSAMDDNLK